MITYINLLLIKLFIIQIRKPTISVLNNINKSKYREKCKIIKGLSKVNDFRVPLKNQRIGEII